MMNSNPDQASEGPSATLTRDAAAIIISVEEGMTEVLGWRPEDLLGRPSTDFIHPEDQPNAIVAWFEMIAAPGETRRFEGRYRTPNGEWKWIESINVNRLDDADNPVVETTMRKITIDKASLAEQLRARQQLLSRLSDAMPIGMFQIDSRRAITFTNDRLHAILGNPPAATVVAQFSCIEEDDQHLLDTALEVVLGDGAVDDVELRFVKGSGSNSGVRRVCVLSMRPLTDDVGHVTGAVGCIADVTEQVSLRKELELRANVDELTSCLSRSAILQLLATVLQKEQEAGGGLSILFVDLCRFKEVNDLFGHAAGDLVLQVAGARLRNMVREGDHVGRLGGDEFLVVCPGITSNKTALEIAERIRRSLTDRLDLPTGSFELQASVGVALSSSSSDPDTLIAQADYAMYEAKRLGSSAVEVFVSR
jgi:diguanylate cyclase (GGDEF)-like protein/PAS domain S-box-containing protein